MINFFSKFFTISIRLKAVFLTGMFSISCFSGLYCQTSFVYRPAKFPHCHSHIYFVEPEFTVYGAVSSAIVNFPILAVFSDTAKQKDKDGDGIIDSLDKCPNEKGVLQYDGCPVPDSDNDGIADDIDECPTMAGLLKYKGCPPGDKDGDKINDEDDKCPDQPGVARYSGCPAGDKDSDGVNDDDDKCIDIFGTVKNAGCPENRKREIFTGKVKNKKQKS